MSQRTMKSYTKEVDAALNDEFLRQTLDKFYTEYPVGRNRSFLGADPRKLIERIGENKARDISRMQELYEEFKKNAEAKGIKVHLAKDAAEANAIIAGIAEAGNCKKIIKSKSMTSEETELNKTLIKKHMEVTETDLGEWIIQNRNEGPTHMVMPAIHLSRFQVADLFSNLTKEKQDSDIESLVKVARKEIRHKFVEGDLGITGANFAIAGTGTIGICTNEGNARLTATLPKIHVAMLGLEKLCSSIGDAFDTIDVLPKNATGQVITTYVSWITGPTECKANEDGQKEFHIVFLDNGRSEISQDPLFAEALKCVRCGACANVCPVYRLIGGHAMGHIYIGAIGLILTYLFHGKENARALAENCVNCEACKDICAADIDLPRLIAEVRSRLNEEFGSPLDSKMLGKVMQNRKLFHSLLRAGRYAQRPVTGGTQYIRHLPSFFMKRHQFRALPALADKPFRDKWQELERDKPVNAKLKVALFAGCAQDFIYPEQLEAALKIFEAHNIEVEFPENQTCCGLPIKMMGQAEVNESVAKQNIEAFGEGNYDYIITLCASCGSHLKHSYPETVNKGYLAAKSQIFADKVIDFSSFCKNILGLRADDFNKSDKKISHHAACHLCRGLDVVEEPEELISYVGEYAKAKENNTCCGFGGTYSIKFPTISDNILKRKIKNFSDTGASEVVTDCPGCIMQLRGGAVKEEANFTVRHIAEIMLENMKKK